MDKLLDFALDKLGREFTTLDLTFHPMPGGNPGDVTSFWPGGDDEDVLVCVFKGTDIHEPFHRQDFFFINFAYENSYDALSEKYNNLITIRENECYIGQPYSGYALRARNDDGVTIIGVLIRRDAFFREYLPAVYADNSLFRFFVDPQTNKFSDEYIHLALTPNHPIRTILELMVVEYANRQADTQRVLHALMSALLLEIARRYQLDQPPQQNLSLARQLTDYIAAHSDTVSLAGLGRQFGYHPNYLSGLLHEQTGRTFSQLVLRERMERAALLLQHTGLSLEEIASQIGYRNASNFYKAFREYYGCTPREYPRSGRLARDSDTTPDTQTIEHGKVVPDGQTL